MRIRRARRTRRIRRTAARTAITLSTCAALLLPLTSCTDTDNAASSSSGGSTEAKNGDTAPYTDAPGAGTSPVPRRAVPRGRGSRLPDDLNGDGHPDLVLNDLVKAAGDTYGDDAGIGIVYGTAAGSGAARRFDPAVRQTLDPRERGARVDGVLPAAFDAEAACDLDGDGFGDLIIATDPPYNGIGRPPVPLQILFGGPGGPTGRAVVLRIPAKARAGDEWPDHPVCGDFDGDGEVDLAVTASAGQVSFLRGPFRRTGAPRAATAPVQAGGPVLAAPEPRSDVNGDGYDDLVVLPRAHAPGTAARGTLLLGGPNGPEQPGATYTFTAVRKPPAPRLPGVPDGKATTEILRATDGYLVTRTHRAESTDLIATYASDSKTSGPKAPAFRPHPLLTFSTAVFLD